MREDIVGAIAKVAGIVAIALVFVFLFSAIGAVILTLLWPLVIPNVFPGLVASGAIASDISFWVAFGVLFMSGMIFKNSSSNSEKD